MAALAAETAALFWRPISSTVQRRLGSVVFPRRFFSSQLPPSFLLSSIPQPQIEQPTKSLDIHGMQKKIRMSPWKLNLVARQIRKLPVEQAIIQATFSPKKASKFIKDVLVHTHERAQRAFNCAKGNLYVAESYVGTGPISKTIRYHGRGRFGIEHNRYAHYFLMLREGPPPPKYRRPKESLKHYKTLKIINAGPRGIPNSL